MANSAQSSSKHRKLRRKPDGNGIDRLSNLPEHLLLHILSFLPTETAVKTSVLSRTWQFLWTLVPNLDFDQSRRHEYQYGSFANFVTKVLLHRKERFIRRFRLKCHSFQWSSDMDSWVSSAIAQNVQELDLDLGYKYNGIFRFYCEQQSCNTLVVLKLRLLNIDGRLDEVSFPALKILHLKAKRQEIKFLPSRFPVLEELVLHSYGFCDIDKVSKIHLPKLRSLTVRKYGKQGLLRIDCPALTHILVKDKSSSEFHLENLLSLVEADVNVRPRQVRNTKDNSHGRYVMNVVKAVSNVRILRLSHHTMKGIELASPYPFFRGDDIPVFHNLVQVELPFVGSAPEFVILMLRKFQHLECLTLGYKDSGDGGRGVDINELIQQTDVPNCLISHLTTFCFRRFRGRDNEMKVTRYILENSLVLKKMTVLFSSSLSSKERRPIETKLCKSPSCSRGFRLEFDHHQSSDSDNDSDSDSDRDSDFSDTDSSSSDSDTDSNSSDNFE